MGIKLLILMLLLVENHRCYPLGRDNSYEYEDTEWYQMAMADKGKVVFTDTYEDAITKESIITSSIALEDEGAVHAMDIYPSKLQGLRNALQRKLKEILYICVIQKDI